jgi:hypothetical protein
MQLAQTTLLGLSLTTVACAATTSAGQPKAPVRGGVLEFRLDSYDGDTVEGRLLLGATVDPLVIDSRIWRGLDYSKLHACDTTERLNYVHFSFIVLPARPDEIITLKPGMWYGGRMRFPISLHWKDDVIGPDCLEATLRAWDNDERLIAELPIRVERTDKKPASNERLGEMTQ